MSLECCAAFKVAALRYTRVESKVCHQLFAMRETAHIAHRRHYSVESDEINAAQTRQAQQRFLGRDFLSHVTAQQGATCSRCHQTTVQLLQQHGARRRPLPSCKQPGDGFGMTKAKALL